LIPFFNSNNLTRDSLFDFQVFTAIDPAGKTIDRSQARSAVQSMQYSHRPDPIALEAILTEWEKTPGKLSLKDFSNSISSIAQWNTRGRTERISGAKVLRKQAEELMATGQAPAATNLIAVAHRLDPRMQAPLEPPPIPAPKYEFPPHMMSDTYQSLRLDYHPEKVKSDIRALSREFSTATLNSPQSNGMTKTVALHDHRKLQKHVLASATHNKPTLQFTTNNLYTNAPHPPLYVAGDDYFNQSLPHRDKLEPASAYSGTATLRPKRSRGTLGATGSATLKDAKSSGHHGHGNGIEPEDLVSRLPKQFDFAGSDDEGDAPADAHH
jgi:hypothetical protein